MVRDEVARTGHLRPDVAAMLETPPVAIVMDGGSGVEVDSAGRLSGPGARVERVDADRLVGAA
jgi:hypothetical protein